ncbi:MULTISPECIES: Ig-like domain-containing protein [unclassified Undibacterium]|uniref:Ig-like domain-containing protein n=1 Tax=unclassified Undibacterium TaxID=2630295 RepID=UPI002AC89E7F|nr:MULTISPECIES: Ig-like domain-containing protein [unclassified Undibacterium]MEB0138643.1 Ig-like domain-containing protein [Undibacterium sp. CCC2.1]MEB0171444.1 Ig-like domain-containing protein [Undibacterium sp. CCC1.1]MEB0175774.1 Ig-like domain-containing protein [Undibacterium sp. CCC3.4]MEB0214398.1 Ig-like domain-containing protein [Undibacterium sp. 5I2]WPX44265.1 Ig-like domain-containing protein [Undibacterium sp. CCC3.4]
MPSQLINLPALSRQKRCALTKPPVPAALSARVTVAAAAEQSNALAAPNCKLLNEKGDTISANGYINTTQPQLRGAEPALASHRIDIYLDGELIGTSKVDEHGNWFYAPDFELSEGQHTLILGVDTCLAKLRVYSAPFKFTVKTTAPQRPCFSILNKSGKLIGDGDYSVERRPRFSGKRCQVGDLVTIFHNENVFASFKVQGDGNWLYTVQSDLSDGDYHFDINVIDLAGNVSEFSDMRSYTVIAQAALKPA